MANKLEKKLKNEADKLISLYNRGNLIELEKSARRFTAMFPDQSFGWKMLGYALQKQKKYQNAHAAYRKALDLYNHDPELHNNMGVTQKEIGLLAEAESSVRTALRLQSDYALAHNNLGNILRAQNNIKDAIEEYHTALNLNPGLAMAYNNLGNAFKELDRHDEAVAYYKKSLEIDSNYAEAHLNLGSVLLDMGKLDEAFLSLSHAASFNPEYSEASNKLGTVLQGLCRGEDAEHVYRSALENDPAHAGLHTNLGNTLVLQGRLNEAITAYRTALNAQPGMADSMIHLVMATLPAVVSTQNESERVAAEFDQAINELEEFANSGNWKALGKAVTARLPFFLSYRPGNHRHLLSRYGDIAAKARCEWLEFLPKGSLPPVEPRQSGRIRLGIISAHVRQHSVWYVLLKGLLQRLDRTRFEVILYHTDTTCDSETGYASSIVDRFEQGPRDWLSLLKKDAPDVIFYPDLAMDPVTFGLALLRLAPLQITTWGHPITSGLPEIDWFLSGELFEGEAACDQYRERLVLLPGTGACSCLMSFGNTPLCAAEINLPDDRSITRFLVCQRAMKFDPVYDDLYAEIAGKTVSCHFWFVKDLKLPWASAIIEKRISDAFIAHGLDPNEYITWVDWIPADQFWNLLEEMDVYLDTPAFSGFTTAWQAAHCGLPVVTIEGDALRQRLASGLLKRIGITETIAENMESYVTLAVKLAQDKKSRLLLRHHLKNAAPLADDDAEVVRAFENTIIAHMQQTGT
jgi:protein O-GlcNAc transferase